MPPSRQIADQLRARITNGDLAPGARLPSITTLMQEHGVARNTARRALAILEDEGLIEIVHGWGLIRPQMLKTGRPLASRSAQGLVLPVALKSPGAYGGWHTVQAASEGQYFHSARG